MSKNNYTVLTQNRFADLISDDDSDTVQRMSQVKPASPKKSVNTEIETRRQRPQRPERKLGETRPTARVADRRPQETKNGQVAEQEIGEEPEVTAVDRHSRGSRTKVAPTRGGRGGIEVRTGQRVFDRHSGTGRGKEMKRSGAGGHNWGNDTADFGGDTTAETQAGESTEEEGQRVVNAESSGENAAAASPVPASAAEKQEEKKMIDFAEYQRAQRLKRAALLQDDSEPTKIRSVDATELEKAGFEKYEREETPEEQAARALFMQRAAHDEEDSDDDPCHRPKTYNLSEFTGGLNMRPRGGRGGRGGRNNERGGRGKPKRPDPIALDLTDAAAFPCL